MGTCCQKSMGLEANEIKLDQAKVNEVIEQKVLDEEFFGFDLEKAGLDTDDKHVERVSELDLEMDSNSPIDQEF